MKSLAYNKDAVKKLLGKLNAENVDFNDFDNVMDTIYRCAAPNYLIHAYYSERERIIREEEDRLVMILNKNTVETEEGSLWLNIDVTDLDYGEYEIKIYDVKS